MVDLEAGVDTTVQTHADGQQSDGQCSIASGIRGNDQAHSWAVLANTVDDLSRRSVRESIGVDHVISHERNGHRENPHRNVGQSREETVLKVMETKLGSVFQGIYGEGTIYKPP